MGKGREGNVGCYAMCFGFVYIISIILVASSFQEMDPLEMGIAKNTILSNIKTGYVYTRGRYFLGLGYKFIKYPSHAINVDITDMSASTSDKQTVMLDVSAQYRIKPSELHDLYSIFSENYQPFFNQQVTEAVKEISVNYQTKPDFYLKRKEIAEAVTENLKVRFDQKHVELLYFQLRRVDFPATVENSIAQISIAQEQAKASTNLNKAVIERAKATTKAKEADSEAKLLQQTAQAEGLVLTGTAAANAFKTRQQAANAAALEVADTLKFNAAQTLKFVYYDTYHQNPDTSNLNAGFEGLAENLLATAQA